MLLLLLGAAVVVVQEGRSFGDGDKNLYSSGRTVQILDLPGRVNRNQHLDIGAADSSSGPTIPFTGCGRLKGGMPVLRIRMQTSNVTLHDSIVLSDSDLGTLLAKFAAIVGNGKNNTVAT